MKRIKWWVHHSLATSGYLSRAAIAAITLAGAFHLLATIPAQNEAAAALASHDLPRKVSDSTDTALSAAAGQAETFHDMFPARDRAPELLDRVYRAARSQSLDLVDGSYQIVASPGGRLVAYQVNLPVAGTYAQVRRFVVQVLRDVPTASLDKLAFERESASSADLAAEVRFTLYMRAE